MNTLINYSLGDVCRVINGRAYAQHELLETGKYKVLRVGNFFSNSSWYYSDLDLENDKYCSHGDLLFAWSASFGPRIWDEDKTIYHYHIWKMVPKEEIIDKKYLYYYLLNRTKSMLKSTHGSVMLHLTKEYVEDLIITIPQDIQYQKNIASILSDIDFKIELNNKINSELEKLAKTIYSYWLLQFEFPNENGKPYKSSGGKMVWSDKLKKEIPEGWKSSSLASLIHESKNGDWGSDIVSNGRTKCFCVRGADIDGLNGIENFNPPIRYIDETHNNRLLKPDDLIIEISGGSPIQSTGRMAHISSDVLTRLGNKVVCSNFCKAVSLITPKLSYIISRYWAHLYDSKVFFNHEGKTSGIKNLLFDQLSKDVTIAIPTDENLINKYYEFEENIDQQKQNNLQQNEELTKLRDWLLPMLMNGQIKVDGEN